MPQRNYNLQEYKSLPRNLQVQSQQLHLSTTKRGNLLSYFRLISCIVKLIQRKNSNFFLLTKEKTIQSCSHHMNKNIKNKNKNPESNETKLTHHQL